MYGSLNKNNEQIMNESMISKLLRNDLFISLLPKETMNSCYFLLMYSRFKCSLNQLTVEF
jgi:hypothetical protein